MPRLSAKLLLDKMAPTARVLVFGCADCTNRIAIPAHVYRRLFPDDLVLPQGRAVIYDLAPFQRNSFCWTHSDPPHLRFWLERPEADIFIDNPNTNLRKVLVELLREARRRHA